MAVKKTIAKKPIKKKARKPKKKTYKIDDPERPLSSQEKIFVLRYITNLGNGTEAAIYAKYAEKAAKEIASRLLTRANIQNYYNEQLQIAFANGGIMVNKAMQGLAKEAFSDITDFQDLDTGELRLHEDMPEHMTPVIKEYETNESIVESPDGSQVTIHKRRKLKLYDAQKAKIKILEMAGKFPNFGNSKNDNPGTGSEEKAIESIKKLIEFQEKITDDTNLKENQTVSEAEKC